MDNNQFCHLHVHNQYSLLDGFGNEKAFAKKAREMKFTHLALTNHGNIDGLIKHQGACESNSIKPLFGCEMYIVNDLAVKDKDEKAGHLTILVKNQTGWRELCRLLTIANIEGFYKRPRIDYKTLLNSNHSGFVIMTGCSGSFLNRKFGEGFFWNLVEEIKKGDLYLEVMPHDFPEQIAHNKKCKELSMKYGIPLVATNDTHYILPEEDVVQEVLLAIQTHAKWKDKTRWKFNVKELHLRSYDEMEIAFKRQNILTQNEWRKALSNTIVIAEKCENFRIERQQVSLPKIERLKKYEGVDDTEMLFILCHKQKLKREELQEWSSEYQKRLNYELHIIQKKKFERYFLIVWDLVKWCRKNDVMIGPGRGCFSDKTKVSLLDGTERTFKELSDNFQNKEFWVYSCDKNGKIVPGKAKNARITKRVNKICIIKIDNGKKIKCTLDHLFLLKNGQYKQAQYLTSGESLMPLYRKIDKDGYEIYFDNFYKKRMHTHRIHFDKKREEFCAHHKDRNKRNNNPDNLIEMLNCEHIKEHGKDTVIRNKNSEFRKKVSDGQKRIWKNKDYKNKMLKKLNSSEQIEKRKDVALCNIMRWNNSKLAKQHILLQSKDSEWKKKVKRGIKVFLLSKKGEKWKREISKRLSGRKLSEETKKKLSQAKKGQIPWNKGKKFANHKVVSVKIINKKMFMYDMEVEKYHNFALSSEVFVHNSVGGSLVAYLLGIHCVDPIKHNLLFSRFINEGRCFTKETKVIVNNKLKYINNIKVGDVVINKYGELDYVESVKKFIINEKLLKIRFQNRDEICTQDHKWIVKNKDGKIMEKLAKDLRAGEDQLIEIF